MNLRVLAIDQGTSSTKALLVTEGGEILARATTPLMTSYPQPGWAEQSAADIWASVQTVIDDIVTKSGTRIDAIAIANQRETLVVWDADTSQAICPAIIWQCRRTAAACAALLAAGHDPAVIAATGLGINPLFPASKLAWVLQNVPAAARLHKAGKLRAGTVDAWLLWNLTKGASFATDHSNAARTQLFDTGTLAFNKTLGDLFGAPIDCLPTPKPSDSSFGHTAPAATALPAGVPIQAMMGDSHAALYGHGVRAPGTVKATYGTGSSLMTLTPARVTTTHGLSGTVAWTNADGTAYALEGNITVSAQAAAFMAQLLGLNDAQALSSLAQTVANSGGVAFVPALAGLGAPYWDDHATGTISGMTHGTTNAHLARATFEAIALQVADVLTAMERDAGHPLQSLRADGGASSNAFLMQLQADILDRPVLRSAVEEVGALGAAAMAFSALGTELADATEGPTIYHPTASRTNIADLRANWAAAVAKARL
ncbi:MAG: FGGY family carbohydrate kinase [bacterium]